MLPDHSVPNEEALIDTGLVVIEMASEQDDIMAQLVLQAYGMLAPAPATIPNPYFIGPDPMFVPLPLLPIIAPDSSELPLPFLRFSGLSPFIQGQLTHLQPRLGDPQAYRDLVWWLHRFQVWNWHYRWHII